MLAGDDNVGSNRSDHRRRSEDAPTRPATPGDLPAPWEVKAVGTFKQALSHLSQ
jgi:hypothetical protein